METKKFLILDTSQLVNKTDYSAKVSEIQSKIPSISSLATNSAVESKITNIINLVKKQIITDHNHDKYIAAPEFNRVTAEVFTARLAQANLIEKKDFDTKLIFFNRKSISSKTKHVLAENKLKHKQHFIQAILKVKIILKKMVLKTVQYFSQCTNI